MPSNSHDPPNKELLVELGLGSTSQTAGSKNSQSTKLPQFHADLDHWGFGKLCLPFSRLAGQLKRSSRQCEEKARGPQLVVWKSSHAATRWFWPNTTIHYSQSTKHYQRAFLGWLWCLNDFNSTTLLDYVSILTVFPKVKGTPKSFHPILYHDVPQISYHKLRGIPSSISGQTICTIRLILILDGLCIWCLNPHVSWFNPHF